MFKGQYQYFKEKNLTTANNSKVFNPSLHLPTSTEY